MEAAEQIQQRYIAQRTELDGVLHQIAQVAVALDSPHQAKAVNALRKGLENEKFNLVVVGEFSRGKSTFINAMLGKKILPASVNPTTAIISRITYGDPPRFQLRFTDNHTEYIEEERFSKLKAPKEVDDFSDKSLIKEKEKMEAWFASIKEACVAYPLEFCRNQVEIIDTPGVNDLSQSRVDVTYRFLKEADAAILLLSAEQILSASEITFLREQICGNQIRHFFVVINFKDKVGADQEDALISYVQTHLREHLSDDFDIPPIFYVSGKKALLWRRNSNGEVLKPKMMDQLPVSLEETGFPAFEERLGEFLYAEKGRAKLKKYAGSGAGVIRQLDRIITMERKAAGQSTRELEEKLAVMRPVFAMTRQRAESITRMLRTDLQSNSTDLVLKVRQGLLALEQQALAEVDGFDAATGSITGLEQRIKEIIAEQQNKVAGEIAKWQKNEIETKVQASVAQINQLLDELYAKYAEEDSHEAYQFHMNDMGKMQAFSAEVSLYNDTGEAQAENFGTLASLALGLGSLIMGGGIFGALFYGFLGNLAGQYFGRQVAHCNQLRSQIHTQVSKINAGLEKNLTERYSKQCETVSDDLEKYVNGHVDAMQKQLQRLIDAKTEKEGEKEARLAELERFSDMLRACGGKIERTML